jgi:hypothetical protein
MKYSMCGAYLLQKNLKTYYYQLWLVNNRKLSAQ